MTKLSKSTPQGQRLLRIMPSDTGLSWVVEVRHPAALPRWEPVTGWATLEGAERAKTFYEKDVLPV